MQTAFFQFNQIFLRPFRRNLLVHLEGTFQSLSKELFRPFIKKLFGSFRRNLLDSLRRNFLVSLRRNLFVPLERTFWFLQMEIFRPFKKEPFRPFKKKSFRPFRRNLLDPLRTNFLGSFKPFRPSLEEKVYSIVSFFIIISIIIIINISIISINIIIFFHYYCILIVVFSLYNVNTILKLGFVFLFFLTLAGNFSKYKSSYKQPQRMNKNSKKQLLPQKMYFRITTAIRRVQSDI